VEVAPVGVGEAARQTPASFQQRRQVEAAGCHLDLVSAERPRRTRPISIELQPVALGIGEVEGFADGVIGKAVELQATVGRDSQPRSELRATGEQQRGMEEPGGARCAHGVRLGLLQCEERT
jgi:hypothetical protein